MRIFGEFEDHADAEAAAELERVRANLASVRSLVAITSAKGGVGKSVVAVNLAAALALVGRKAAIVDLDFNSPSVMSMLGMRPPRHLPLTEGIEPLGGPHGLRIVAADLLPGGAPHPMSFLGDAAPAEAPEDERLIEMSQARALRMMLGQTRFGALDYAIFDLAPGLSNLHLLARTAPLHGVVLMSHPSGHAAHAARHGLEVASLAHLPVLGIVENMAGFHCDGCRSVRPLWPEGELPSAARESGLPILGRLPFDRRLAESSDRGVLFVRDHADTPIGKTFGELARQVEAAMAARR
jgi:ATP-binding protein involved in chromosome partitioning